MNECTQKNSPIRSYYKNLDRLFLTSVFTGNGQFMTSFFSAARKYFSSTGGSHTLSETMHTFTTAFMGLIGAFFTWHLF